MIVCSLLGVLWEVFGSWSVHSADDDVVSFVGLQGDSLDWSEPLLLELLNLGGVDDLWGESGIDTGGLDGNHEMTAVLYELGGVEAKNTGLIWLCDIGEDDVDHWHEHSVLLGMSGILDDGDDVGPLLGHVHEVSTGTLGELNGVDASLWANKVGNMGHSSSGSASEVEHLTTRLHVDVANTSDDSGSNLGSERVPDPVLGLGTGIFVLKVKSKDRNIKFRNKK